MSPLTAKEKELLDKLNKKADEPDAPAVSKSISANIDLSDDKQIAAAIKHGFLTADEVEELQEDERDDKGKKQGAATPRRRGYFKDDDKGDE